MKQFNVEQLIFDDAIVSYEGIAMKYGVTNENWILVDDDKVNEISASITNGGAVWLENGEVKCSGKAPSNDVVFNKSSKNWIYNCQYSLTEKRFDALGIGGTTHNEGWYFVESEATEAGIKESLTSGQVWVENGKLHYSGAAPSDAHSFDLKTKQWTIDTEKQAAQKSAQIEQIRSLINAKRDACVSGGVYVEQIKKWVDTDKTGQDNLVQIKADFDLNGKEQQFSLICADNTVHQLNFDDFVATWNAVRELKTSMYENAYMHKVLLQNSDNPTDYDWSIGWAKTYNDFLEEGN
ncbi:DUF4376 domain-containing protein [Actinobacillus equuli subsp. haemolyticus]|uniref:DUF4376 domain-containing protein n=1 Tax=Actinobacillus equuli TaxID=718 RepID=UPI0024189EDF|nr:DUF4376 domain-containing protein [Actinobacillus equuli]MDG4948724.1 DUF4376 domain-containing protein [Actinobacillus equuli subsp. haemolyticus]WGE63783.1 DUF4376 domain-containing protein [Actinobacillus equuli subsp. haemolyticus]